MLAGQDHKPKKAKRVSKACDFCHSRSIRCRPSAEEGTARCQNCFDYQHPCRYTRPTLKRGTRARTDNAKAASTPTLTESNSGPSESPSQWHCPATPGHAVIVELVGVFLDICYPQYPFFHRDITSDRVHNAEYETNKPFFVCVMAMCAVTSGRVRDGALFKQHPKLDDMRRTAPSVYFRLAEQALPNDLEVTCDFNYLRGLALLSVSALQEGHIRNFIWYLGAYLRAIQVDGLHIEARWPRHMSAVEIEERRRLFWGMYALDVFSAAVFDTMVTLDEESCLVSYPLELEDDVIASMDSAQPPPSHLADPSHPHWLHGWNLVTEQYRVLAHAIKHARYRRHFPSGAPPPPPTAYDSNLAALIDRYTRLMQQLESIPQILRDSSSITGDAVRDRYGFQASRLIAARSLLHMTVLSAQSAPVEQKCQLLLHILSLARKTAVEYLQAMSTPTLFFLAGLGTSMNILSEAPHTIPQFDQIRGVLTGLSDCLARLESGMSAAKGASERLKALIRKVDEHAKGSGRSQYPTGLARPREDLQPVPDLTAEIQGAPPAMSQPRGLHGVHQSGNHHGMVPPHHEYLDEYYMPMDPFDPNMGPG